jgi:hypothetical protein
MIEWHLLEDAGYLIYGDEYYKAQPYCIAPQLKTRPGSIARAEGFWGFFLISYLTGL